MAMLLQMRCFIINPTLNVVIKNIRSSISKKLKEKNIDEEKTSLEKWYKIHSLNKVIHNVKQTENENPGCF